MQAEQPLLKNLTAVVELCDSVAATFSFSTSTARR